MLGNAVAAVNYGRGNRPVSRCLISASARPGVPSGSNGGGRFASRAASAVSAVSGRSAFGNRWVDN